MRIFVASTYEELLDYRAAVTRSVLAGGNSPEDMIDWPADDSPALDVSIRKVRASDLIILIVAHGYGNPPPNESKSVTELEFDEAVRLRIPVIAFIVNPGHAWPPKYIEIDPRRRRCREAFIARIEETVTRGEFSSPESLELAVTKALAGFRARKVDGKEVQVAFPERLQTVYRPESLHYKPDALVWIGKAPDGAPMAFSVLRNVSLTREISDLAQRFHKTLADAPFDDIHETLSQEARDYAVAADLHTGRAGRSIEDVYLYPRALVSIFAPSLFQSMLQAPGYTSQARASHPRQYDRPDSAEGTMSSGYAPPERGGRSLPISLGGDNRFLCIALNSDKGVWSGGWDRPKAGDRKLTLWRPFIEEGLERLEGTQYGILETGPRQDQNQTWVYTSPSQAEYRSRWTEYLCTLDPTSLLRLQSRIIIPRSTMMQFALALLREVDVLHQAGRIHGDIKPSNILVGRSTSALIDEVNLDVGDISPTVTPGWSPPEQLLRQPLSCAGDVYPLGLILLHILAGEILGKQVEYRLPGGRMATTFDNAAVYISPSILPGSRERRAWAGIVEGALRTDPSERWPTAGALAEAIANLLSETDLQGQVHVSFPWGDRPSLLLSEGGAPVMGWIAGPTPPPILGTSLMKWAN